MRFKVTHKTHYQYADYVSLCQNQARLMPCSNYRQVCLNSTVTISPNPSYQADFVDYFGNIVTVFEVPTLHKELTVISSSEIELLDAVTNLLPPDVFAWEQSVQLLQHPRNAEELAANEYCLPSPFIPLNDALRDFALQSFTPNRLLVEASHDLMHRIFTEFKYDPGFSTISTPILDVLLHKKGVCQDFAHLAIGCLRSIGLAARYVSGYIETVPPEGQVKLEGADATHAWFSIYIPDFGWYDFDPTNDISPKDQHITTAVGRDFSDVTPLKGVIFGGGSNQLQVAVDVTRL